MKADLLTSLPSEISLNIILRLPLRAIAISKCVCKPWLHFLDSDDFVKFHLSKSAPSLAVMTMEEDSNWCKLFELEDELNLDRRRDPISKFAVPRGSTVEGSANGLLLLHSVAIDSDSLYVCNPITSELCELSIPQGVVAYGLGASRVTGQHKVVSINSSESDYRVLTLGTGSWRRIEAEPYHFQYGSDSFGAFVNGNLHWLVSSYLDDTKLVSCFNVETERFSTFPAPPTLGSCRKPWFLYGLGDRLCFSDESADDEIAIWFVKDYEQVEKTWSKEYVIGQQHPDFDIFGNDFLRPIKVFKNGDLLMLCGGYMFIYYSNETKMTQGIGLLAAEDGYYFMGLKFLTPSFLSLRRSFGMENVVIV